ncbi:hypothetical protein [Methylocystis parvus]|uniref:Uncharacterized protein n=1 Tax=Methylocystis parvus TaxID=134 RepID=A0A6B8MB69_9HYPH|nr:hypothetical protein [Methylocystis parvus]QGM99961.1 hypothetical protein F7D14_20470 [Methylocystis parvus]WBK02190.1 hypothetical protein MMG94_20315 [Methylocystis parvus OBBP]
MTAATRYDRAAVMWDAHKRYRDGQRLGLDWSFGRCLSTAWKAAKMRRTWPRNLDRPVALTIC